MGKHNQNRKGSGVAELHLSDIAEVVVTVPALEPGIPVGTVVVSRQDAEDEVRLVDKVRQLLDEQAFRKFNGNKWKNVKKEHFFHKSDLPYMHVELTAKGFTEVRPASEEDMDAVMAEFLRLLDPQADGAPDQKCILAEDCTSGRNFKFQPYSWGVFKEGKHLLVNAPGKEYDRAPVRAGQVVLNTEGTAVEGYVCRKCRDGYYDLHSRRYIKGLYQRGVGLYDTAGAKREMDYQARQASQLASRGQRSDEGLEKAGERFKARPMKGQYKRRPERGDF